MNLTHLSSKLRLDVEHLLWQQRSQHLSEEQLRDRFESIARGYRSLVPEDDRERVDALIRHYQKRVLH